MFEKFILKSFYKFENLKTLKTILNFFFYIFDISAFTLTLNSLFQSNSNEIFVKLMKTDTKSDQVPWASAPQRRIETVRRWKNLIVLPIDEPSDCN